MHPHFYFVSFLKWIWKCVLTDCNTKEPMLKNDYTHPLSKTMQKNHPNFVLPPKAEAALRAAKDSGSCTELLVRFSHHIWWAMLEAWYSPFLFISLVMQSLQGNIYMTECSQPQWHSPIHGLDFESGISPHWLTAWVCFSKWLYYNYKFKWVNLLDGGLVCLCAGNIYSIKSTGRRNDSAWHKALWENSTNRSHICKSKQFLSGRFYFIMSLQLLHPQNIWMYFKSTWISRWENSDCHGEHTWKHI